MAAKTKRISTLIESQLPEFITTEYELFGQFVQKYYEQQEVQGGVLDIANNFLKYRDIDFYEKKILKENDTLSVDISETDDTIVVLDASSFPENNGYIRINDEIIFYEDRNQTTFFNCSRGVSGNTTLGDLYDASKFESTNAAAHNAGSTVHNVSNLFLYAFIKSFENQYLGSFPEKYLRGEVDKRTLIKNIQKFYKAKGTASSIKFIFNTIVTKDIENKPEVYNPKDFTYKASTSDWVNVFALKCKIVSGDPKSLIGKKIVQQPSEEYGYASATVDNVRADGTKDGEVIYNIIVAPETVNGEFGVSTKTVLEKELSVNAKRANVHSTLGWKTSGSILIDEEIIEFDDKTTTQFVIKNRPSPLPHSRGASVYKPVTLTSQNVVLLSLGIVYNATVKDGKPFSAVGDKLQVSNPGFETSDVTIVNTGSNTPRWNLNVLPDISATTNTAISGQLDEIKPNVSSIFGDDQYYYITSSSFPSHNILDRTAGQTETVKDQKILRIIRKEPIATTERYKTPKRDIGLLLNGVPLYSYKDLEDIQYGLLEKITVANRGRGYVAPPYVLVNGLANKAKAVLVGSSIDKIEVNTTTSYTNMPSVEVTSGRGGVGKAIVTDGEITSIQVENPGEFYSSPPIVRITDLQGKGRFADFSAVIDPTGKITEFVQNAPGNLYTQQNVRVDIIAVGQDGSAVPTLKTWTFNRYEKLKSVLDTSNGQLFENYDPTLYYGYGCVANPVSLRQELNDNITGSGQAPSVLSHSPILGFAYDGNPIYGPYGYVDPTDPQSAIRRMTSSYVLKENRQGGPTLANYPIGSFINDYEYQHRTGSLDENNGRFCITPDYPEGTYAYFMTLDADLNPAFPYTVGDNFYSLPVDSNYNSNINQNDVPKNSKRLFVPGMQGNGEGLLATIDTLKSGTVQGVEVEQSSDNFSVNSKIFFDNQGTEGFDAESIVSSVKGKPVAYLQSKEDKVVKLTTIQSAYLFEDDFLRQPSSGASGQIVGTVQNDNLIVLKNVVGTFDNTGTFSADIKTFTLFLDQDSSYTKGAIVSLTDGVNDPIATGEVLESTSRQNSVVIKVLSGTWIIDENYTLRSDNLFNTVGSRIVVITSLSDNLNPFDVNQSVALIETTENHGLGIGDKVTIDVNPDDALKTKTYYLRKRLFQNVTFITPSENTSISDTGLGRFKILNGGAFYTAGNYTDVPLTGGSGTGAKATIRVSEAGIVNLVTITDKGSGYKRGDYLGVDDEQLVRSQGNDAIASTQRIILYVAHVGFAKGELILNVDNADGFADNDLIQIGEEVVKIVDISGNAFLVERAQEGSEDIDHFDGESVSLYKPTYHFTPNYEIDPGNAGSGFIKSYDQTTQTALIEFNYSSTPQTASVLSTGQRFFDPGNPKRLVTVATVEDPIYKYEFSEDNITFVTNPNIQVQEFYKYVFDTSHSSLTGTFFELSPSTGYSLLTLEKVDSAIAPGNPGSFSDVKFGFGPRTVNNDYSEKVGTNYTNFYYFDKNGVVDAEQQYLSLINDPLQGEKVVTYVTRNRFVYDVQTAPLFDGSGTISYTTSGQFAVGEINTVGVINLGSNYKKPPIISGVNPSAPFKATATVLFDDLANVITGVRIDTYGLNYSKPIALVSGNGTGARFQVTTRDDGSLFAINIISAGRGYTEVPTVEIVESDVRLFVESNNIGVPASVTIQNNGGAYHLDKTVSSTVTSKYTISTTNRSEKNFIGGEKVIQTIDGEVVLRAVIAEITPGSNLIKLEQVRGIVREGVQLTGVISEAFATVKTVFVTEFDTEIRSFYDNIGYYTSDRGRVSTQNQRLTDSFFYQDYSYVVKSKTSIEQWRDLIKSTTHPAGFKLFGQVDVETDSSITMPDGRNNESSSFSTIELWDPEKNKITSRFEKQVVTNTIVKVENTRIRKTAGSASSSEFDFASLTATDVRVYNLTPGFYDDVIADGKPWYIKNPFNGVAAEDFLGGGTNTGILGDTVFQLRNDRDEPFTPYSAENLIVTLDGILQEPGVAYTVNQDKITFAQPPLGTYQKLSGSSQNSLFEYKGTRFTARHIEFKDASYNDRYFRKIRNIFQRNGRWIDAANQIDRNIDFIINESVGYGREKYPDLDWSTKLDDYQDAVRYVAQSFDHDLRFGGNTKTSNYAAALLELQYISRNKAASLDIFKYATKLSNLAIRNWDTTQPVSYIVGSTTVTVNNSDDLAIGMYISSGRSFPDGTRITEIIDRSTIKVSRAPFVNSGGGGGAVFGETTLDGETNGTQLTIPTSIGVIEPGNEFAVTPDDTFTVPLSFAGTAEATFYLSGINNGTFYDAANLIEANKEYLQSEVSNFTWDNYPNLETNGVSKEKCFRDIGYLVDAMVHHLKFGGNERIVRFGQLYFTQGLYPYGQDLTYLKTDLEQEAADYAWDLVGVLAIQAMRNVLPAATYGSSPAPVVDNDVAIDSQFPYCVEVESAINSMITIVKDIIDNGPGSIIPTAENENKAGNWTPTKTYSNYAIIPDPELPDNECTDVISALLNLYDNLEDVIYDRFVEVTRPDFINGEETVFDLYWENGDPVVSEKDENILLTVNAVLQQTKFNAEYPGQDSYYINRDANPNQIVFDVAPIWDQDIGAKTLGEPTNVEKVTGHGVGNYKRLTIDPALINNVRSGPFLILDLEDLTVQPVDDPDFLLVFIDGVLQQPGASYSVSGPNIQFTFPITDQMKVDMRYVYGRDIGQVLRLYDYEKGRLFAKSELRFTAVGGLSEFLLTDWREVDRSSPLQIYQVRDNGFVNFLGQVIQRSVNGNSCYFSLFGQKAELLPDRPLTFTVKGNYSLTTDITFTDGTLVYQKDLDGKLLMSGNDNLWYGTRRRFDYRTPFVNIANGDLVKIDGEDKFRRIKDLPTVARTKDERLNSNASDAVYGTVQIERYNGITRGEGLSVVATVTNGVVTDLTWNQRSYDPITQPTAYQYYTPPILHFIPKNGSGGGARAAVIVSKGQVLSIELISGGEGYTEAPDVVVARRYTIYTERDVATAGVGLSLQPIINPAINVISNISVLGNQRPGINTFTSILFRSPIESNRKITSILHLEGGLERNVGTGLDGGLDEILQKRNENIKVQSFDMDTIYSEISILLASPFVDEIDVFSMSTLKREHYDSTKITNTVTNVINNTQLSNASAFAPGAFLDVDLDLTDNVIYIPDTSLFSRTGELLVGDEVIKYYLKLGDRFMKLRRGQQGTTAKFWPAGTFIRELPDDLIVTTAVAGVVTVQSVADVTSLKAAPEVGGSEQTNTRRFEDVFVRMSNVAHRNITAELQIGVDLVSISEVQLRHDTKYELRARAISMSEITDIEVETDVETDVLVDTVTSVSVLSARIHPDVITQVASSSTIRTEAISVIPYESVFSVDYTEHKETTIEQELWKFLDANTWEVTETVLEVKVKPSVVSTYQTFTTFTEAVTLKPAESIGTIGEIFHKETTVLGEVKKLLTANTFEVTQTILDVTLRPTVVSTSQTFSTFTESVGIKPAESIASFNSLAHEETTVEGELWKFLDANTWEVTQTILDVTVRPTVTSTSEITVLNEIVRKVSTEPLETAFDSLAHEETTVLGEVKKFLTANTFEVTQTILDVTIKPTVVSTSQTFNTFTDAIAVRPSETATRIDTIAHKETFIRFERDRFSDIQGSITFNFEVTETNVGVKINPVAETVSFISHASELKAEVKREPTVVSSPPVDGITEIVNVEVQSVLSQFTMQKNQLEVLLFTPPSGVVDGYAENVLIADPILTRDSGFIDLVGPPYTVTKRDTTVVDVVNQSTSTVSDYIGSYEKTNAGHTISHFGGIFDDGSAKVSGVSLEEFSLNFPSLTIRDFELRGSSSYTLAGIRFNLMPPSIQDPVAISATTTTTIGGIITVQNEGLPGSEPTKYFTDSGYLFTSGGTVIQYTSKTATTFEGCSVISGPTTLTSGDDLIPFQN